MAEFTPEKCKQIALARLDVVHKWLEFRKQSQNKLQAIDVTISQAIAKEAKANGYNLVISKQGKVLYSSDDLTSNIQKAIK